MEVVDFLIQQHREVEALMDKALESESAADRLRYFKQAANHLAVHVESEEHILFPAVKAHKTEDILLESLEEHLSLKRLVADLNELSADDTTFEPKLKVLKEQTEHHHEEEEDDLFPKIRNLLSETERRRLAEAMQQLQDRLKDAGSPRHAMAEETDQASKL